MSSTITVEAAENLRHVAGGSLVLLDRLSSDQILQLSTLQQSGAKSFTLLELVQASKAPTHLLLRAALHCDDWWSYQLAVDLMDHPNATVGLFNALVAEFSRRVPPWLDEPLEASVLCVLERLFATGLIDEDRQAALASSSPRVAELVFAAARTMELSFANLDEVLLREVQDKGQTSSPISPAAETEDMIHPEVGNAGESAVGDGLSQHRELLDKQIHADLELLRHRDCPSEIIDLVVHFLCREGVERLGTDPESFGVVLLALSDCPAFERHHVELLRSRFSLMTQLWTPALAAGMRSREAGLMVLELPAFMQPAVVGVLRANYGVDFDSALEAVTLLN